MSPGVDVLSHCLILNLNSMLITLNVVLLVPELYLSLLTSLLRMSRSVGQDVSPGKCVLLSTSRAVRPAVKLWDISGEGGFWKVQLDVRDLGGHLDFTYRARAGTLSGRVGKATVGVTAVGALPLGFLAKLGLVRGKVSFLLVYMPLRLLMSPRRPLVLLGVRLCSGGLVH